MARGWRLDSQCTHECATYTRATFPARSPQGRLESPIVADAPPRVELLPEGTPDGDGSFHTENMHVTERFTRKGNTIEYQLSVEDPSVMARPFVARPRTLVLGRAGTHATEDYPCRNTQSTTPFISFIFISFLFFSFHFISFLFIFFHYITYQ